jgi:hypothetical protein
MVTSKPAKGEWPGLMVFTLLPASCPLDFAWPSRAFVFVSEKEIQPQRLWELCETRRSLPSFPSVVGTVEANIPWLEVKAEETFYQGESAWTWRGSSCRLLGWRYR